MSLLHENCIENCKFNCVEKGKKKQLNNEIKELYKFYNFELLNSKLNEKMNMLYNAKYNITKFKILTRKTELNDLYIESCKKENLCKNLNNRYGFIKKLIYEKSNQEILKLDFLIHDNNENMQIYLVEINNISPLCRTVFDIQKCISKRELDLSVSEININGFESNGFKSICVPLNINKTKQKIYNFIILKGGKIVSISDYFSLITTKAFFRQNIKHTQDKNNIQNSFIRYHYNLLMEEKHNDFHYYMNALFDSFDEKRKIQKIKSQLFFQINFYNINSDGKQSQQTQKSNTIDIKNMIMTYIKNKEKMNILKRNSLDFSIINENIKDNSQDGFIGDLFYNEKVIGKYQITNGEVGIFRMDGKKVGLINKYFSVLFLFNEDMKITYELRVIKLKENKYFLVEESQVIEEFEIFKDKAIITKVIDTNNSLLKLLLC